MARKFPGLLVQPTFRFIHRAPASGSGIVAGTDGPGTVGATDAGIMLIVKRIVWDLVFFDVGPDIVLTPGRERITLDESEFGIPFDEAGISPCRGLIPTDPGNPGGIVFQDLCERINFTQLATLIRVMNP